jgi:hypothetical protein
MLILGLLKYRFFPTEYCRVVGKERPSPMQSAALGVMIDVVVQVLVLMGNWPYLKGRHFISPIFDGVYMML